MSNNNKKFRITQGNCPNCDSDNLDYGDSYPYESDYLYEFQCMDCGIVGEEHYTLSFDGYSVGYNDDYFENRQEVEFGKQKVEDE